MTRGFLPSTDDGLRLWSENFLYAIEASPDAYGVSAEQVAAFGQLQQDYALMLQRSLEPDTRGPMATFRKNQAREALKTMARQLGKMIGARLDMTDQQRLNLGLTIPKQRSRIGQPAEAPTVTVQSVDGRSIELWLHDAANNRVRLPNDVAAACVFYAVGESWPAKQTDWLMAATTTRARVTVHLPADVRPGSKVWLTACWLNPRSERGPTTLPQHTYTQFGGVMRLAA